MSSPQLLTDNEVNSYLRKRLKKANARKSEAINRHVRGLRDALKQEADDAARPIFAGSFDKNTFVDGLSDIDILIAINDSSLSGQSPRRVIKHMADLIENRMPKTKVRTGSLAVTVTYSDNYEIQVLPAIRTKKGIKIPTHGSNQWSRVVHPERFVEKLIQVNGANKRKVIPTIKLVKAMVGRFGQSKKAKPSGYHIESLAIEAFDDYHGETDFKSMVICFLRFSVNAVKNPIKDSTGQSRYVDEYLGRANSTERREVSAMFRNMRKRLNGCRSTEDLDRLFA